MTASDAGMRALVSIHDVMPETRERVTALLDTMPGRIPPERIVLLVVPGRDWSPADLDWLRKLRARGHELAGHGWTHQCAPPRGLYHKVHSVLLSRDAAEHLSLDPTAIAALIRANFDWFSERGLGEPSLYVPPAWALGRVSRSVLRTLPFRYYETLSGVYDSSTDRFRRLPVIGFEADTPARAVPLRVINALQWRLARWLRRAPRIAIHPHDAELELAGDLRASLDAVTEPLVLSSLFRRNSETRL